jgi:manganese/iron transport system permease protein
MDVLIEALSAGFMQRGLLAGALVALACGLIGCHVVLRRMDYVGDALAHSVLPGVAVAYVLRFDLLWGGAAAGLLAAMLMARLNRDGRIRESTAIGVVVTGALALGVVIISATRSYARDLSHILFGNVLAVSTSDLAFCALAALLVCVFLWLTNKELALSAFDAAHARKIGVPVALLRTLLLMVLALVVVAGAGTVGTLMVTALLITPAATASLLTRRLDAMLPLSAGIAVFSSVSGLFAAYVFDVAPGATIVLVATAIFLLTLGVRRGG